MMQPPQGGNVFTSPGSGKRKAEMGKDRALEKRIAGLLKSRKFAVLSTSADEQPYASLVAFVEEPDLTAIFFATDRRTKKYQNILANSRIALLVENSTNAAVDVSEAMAATVMGRAEITGDDEKGRLVGIYVKKHPYLADFVQSPGCAMVKLRVEKVILVERFQRSSVLEVT